MRTKPRQRPRQASLSREAMCEWACLHPSGRLNALLGDGAFEIPVTVDPKNEPVGNYRDTVNIKLENDGKAIETPIQVPVNEIIMSDVECTPGAIFLGLMKPGSSKQGMFNIVSKSRHSINFLSFQTTDKLGFRVKLIAVKHNQVGTQGVNIAYDLLCPPFSGNASFKILAKVVSGNRAYTLMIPVIVYAEGS
jgi:hypothetical protein